MQQEGVRLMHALFKHAAVCHSRSSSCGGYKAETAAKAHGVGGS